MKILFCGTPDFAVPSLKKLHALAPAHEVIGVVSQPDKPKGRSGIPTPPPVVAAALELGIPRERIFQPRSINKPEILDAIRALKPDILCVIAYGNILKADALALGKYFPINAHASLLPKHRGAAPIQAALLAGDSDTGVCVMKMEAGLDTGPVLLRRTLPIALNDTAGTLHDKLADLSAECFAQALDMIEKNTFLLEPQDDSRATYAGKLEKRSGIIDWTKPAAEIERMIRAMTPWPGAWTRGTPLKEWGPEMRFRIAEAALCERICPRGAPLAGETPGAALTLGETEFGKGTVARFEVLCGDGKAVSVTRVQPEGKREMSVNEFLRGAGKAFAYDSDWK